MRSLFRRGVRILVIVIAVFIGLAALMLVGFRSPWGREKLATLAEQQAERLLDADISIGEIRGNLFSSPTVHDLTISRHGEPIVSAERIDLSYDLRQVLGGAIAIDSVTLTRPVIYLKEGPDGITLLDLFSRDRTTPPNPQPFEITPILIVDGRVVIGPAVNDFDAFAMPDELRNLQARLGIERSAARTRIHIEHLSFVGHDPRVVMQKVSGGIAFADGDLAFEKVEVETAESRFTLDGTIENVTALGSPL